jgi:hypothetical protein
MFAARAACPAGRGANTCSPKADEQSGSVDSEQSLSNDSRPLADVPIVKRGETPIRVRNRYESDGILRNGSKRPSRRRALSRGLMSVALVGGVVTLAACPQTSQFYDADIEILSVNGGVLFSDSPSAPNRVAFQHAYGSSSLAGVPNYALSTSGGGAVGALGAVVLRYANSDALAGDDRIDVLVFDRDPDEHLATMASIVG